MCDGGNAVSRYVIKFSKEGTIRYISHLDLLRLFKRSFKRTGIKLEHSQGFNPHPKMSFAQPLSLGYLSSGEYLEFDTTEACDTNAITEKLNSVMPEGLAVISCKELPKSGKSLAALTNAADYEILIPLPPDFTKNVAEEIRNYVSREKILVLKHQKKSGKDTEVDIKPMISELNGMINSNNIMITTKLAAGSASNLSPELVLSTFTEFAGIPYDRAEVFVKRTEIYFQEN